MPSHIHKFLSNGNSFSFLVLRFLFHFRQLGSSFPSTRKKKEKKKKDSIDSLRFFEVCFHFFLFQKIIKARALRQWTTSYLVFDQQKCFFLSYYLFRFSVKSLFQILEQQENATWTFNETQIYGCLNMFFLYLVWILTMIFFSRLQVFVCWKT